MFQKLKTGILVSGVLFVTSVISTLSYAQHPTAPITTTKTVSEMLLEPVVLIQDSGGHGSGFFVSPNSVVTARHVAENLDETGAYIIDYKGNKHRILDTKMSYDADVALIIIDQPDPDQIVVKVNCEMPVQLQTVIAAGHPLGYRNIVAPAMVVGFSDERDMDDVTSLVIAGYADPGMSGGPLYDLEGKVVAVHSSRYNFQVDTPEVFWTRSDFSSAVPTALVPELCPKEKVEVPVEPENPETKSESIERSQVL